MYICKCESDKTGLYDNVMIHLGFITCSKRSPENTFYTSIITNFWFWWISVDQNILLQEFNKGVFEQLIGGHFMY